LKAFEAQGVVKLVTAFSRLSDKKCYVQDELSARRDEVWGLLEAGAQVYVCGDASRMAGGCAANVCGDLCGKGCGGCGSGGAVVS
jgi:sulfite reductase alpha subunit-like flavoprotein